VTSEIRGIGRCLYVKRFVMQTELLISLLVDKRVSASTSIPSKVMRYIDDIPNDTMLELSHHILRVISYSQGVDHESLCKEYIRNELIDFKRLFLQLLC